MIKTNYHTHTYFSDGLNSAEEIIRSAIQNNFKILGFSDHSPVPFPSEWNMKLTKLEEYNSNINYLKLRFNNDIIILKGLEVDYFDEFDNFIAYKNPNYDYLIGSVHYIPIPNSTNQYVSIDKDKRILKNFLEKYYGNDIQKLVNDYFERISNMIQKHSSDIIGHIDQIAKFNKNNYFFNSNDKWYKSIIHEIIKIIKNSDSVLEINTRSYYRGILNDFSPSSEIIISAFEKNIPLTLDGDVHNKDEFNFYWDKAIKKLKKIGIKELYHLDKNGWHSNSL